MLAEEKKQKQQQFRTVINKNIESVIRESMGFGLNSKEPFRRKVTFQKLIDYKFKDETEEQKFKRFVTMADNIVENIKLMFPFINLDGIDLTWTTEELQNKIYEIFEQTPEMNLINCPRLSEEERKVIRKKKSKIQKELEAKLEAEFHRAFNIPEDEKVSHRMYLIEAIRRYIPNEEQKAKEKYIGYSWIYDTNGNRKYISSEFELDLLKVFPEVKELPTYNYTRFMDMMKKIKVAYKID